MSENTTELDKFQSQDFSRDYRLRALFSMIPSGDAVLDVGSGNGAIADLRRGLHKQFTLVDISKSLVHNLQIKFQGRRDVAVRQADARSLPWQEEFDVISACDILEHIKEDDSCMKSFFKALKPGGTLFISVPAFPSLYGRRDAMYGHLRRYTKKGLRFRIEQGGFEIEKMRYWNATGLVPYLISEKVFKKPLVAPGRTAKTDSIFAVMLNSILYGLLRLEALFPPPLGLSIIAICRKKAQTNLY